MSWVLVLVVIGTERAEAYLDPAASGSLVQLVIAAAGAAVATAGFYWRSIRSFFRRVLTRYSAPKD